MNLTAKYAVALLSSIAVIWGAGAVYNELKAMDKKIDTQILELRSELNKSKGEVGGPTTRTEE